MIAVVPFLIFYAPDAYAAPITIPEPSGYPTTTNLDYFGYNEIYNNRSAILDSELFSPENNNDKGEIYIQSNTRVLPHPQFTPGERLISVFDVLTNNPANITKPSNVVGNHNILLIHSTVTTPPGPHTYSRILSGNTGTAPLLLDKEVRVSINSTGISSPKPFFFSTFENITQGHPIPECSATNFDSSAQTLKDNYKMCFGILNDYVVVITKRLGHFGVTTTLNAPSTPIDIHARTLSIPPLTNKDPTGTALVFRSDIHNDGQVYAAYDARARVSNVLPTNSPGDIHIQSETFTLVNDLFKGTGAYSCSAHFESVSSINGRGTYGDSRIEMPNNTSPDTTAAYGLDFYNDTSKTTPCSPDPEATSTEPLITNKEIRITIYSATDKKPFYFSPRDNITDAQPIPACTTDMIDTSNNNVLKGGNTVCYGVHGNDVVIITKRLVGFYGAADSVTTPTNPVDLNPVSQTPSPTPIAPPDLSSLLTIQPLTTAKPLGAAMQFLSNSNTDGQIYHLPNTRAGVAIAYQGDISPGDIHLQGNIFTLVTDLFKGAGDYSCWTQFERVSGINTYGNYGDSVLEMPNNTSPNAQAYGLDFFSDVRNKTAKCSPDPEAVHSQPLVTDKEIRITIYNATDKWPFYFSPRDNITTAQLIPACTTGMIDTSNNNALKGDNTLCYGRNGADVVIITKRLTGFYGVADSVTTPADPTDLNAAIPVVSLTNPVTGKIQTHEYYTEKINSTSLIEYPNPVFLYNTLPLCEDSVRGTHQTIQMTTKGDILFKYALNGVQFDGRLFLTLTDHTPKKTISLDSNFVQQRGHWYNYNSTLPKSILDQFGNFTSINARLFVTNDTIPNKNIFSNSSTGSPLYYKSQKKAIMELPDAADTVTFVPGKVPGVRGNVHVPQGDTVPLTAEILCQFGHIQPSPSAQVFDLGISADNATNGLEIKYEFTSKTFYQGAEEQKPTKFFWIATDSDGNSVNGDTTRTITNSYNFVIPQSTSGTYDIVIYGSDAERTLIGTHAGSYTFAAASGTNQTVPTPVTNQTTPTTHGQTLTITIPNTTPSTATIGLNTQTANEIKFITRETSQGNGTRYHHHDDDSDDTRADITIHYNTKITSKTFNVTSNSFCYNAELQVGDDITIPKLNNYTALALEITDFTPKCTNYPNISFDGKLVLNKEVYIRLNNTDGQNIFYHVNGTNDIVQIPKCTSTNFNSTNNTLRGSTEICYGKDGTDTVIVSKILAIFGATTESIPKPGTSTGPGTTKPTTGDDQDDKDSDTSRDLANAPTFGISQLTGEQLVTCGYKMDDTCRDITGYHVQYERDTIQTNTTHTFAIKTLAPNMLHNVILAFSVPNVGSPVSAAEAYISVHLGINYSEPSHHYITDVTIHDPNNIIAYNTQNTTVSAASCSGTELQCTQITLPDVLFRDMMNHEPFAIQVTDTLRFTSINYMNEGVFVTGTSLNAPPTVQPGLTLSSDDGRPVNLILVRTDKVSDLWADAFGNTWSRNSFGNFVIVQYAPYAGTTPVCTDINDRICAPFKAKLDWHNQKMIELRDSLYDAYKTKAYAEIDNIFTYEFGDMDSRTRTLINLGWLTE